MTGSGGRANEAADLLARLERAQDIVIDELLPIHDWIKHGEAFDCPWPYPHRSSFPEVVTLLDDAMAAVNRARLHVRKNTVAPMRRPPAS